ncbi:hypothetical protein J8L70_07835 [Pseudoalteromonas sp. MMG010]|uniref:hypothetical protein n=1 Tax=Pseudoalteromonas sp. MMG010 TaxID=2822685 RepID=UPI001B3A57EF|nr:hypothetical protein [Pseudoalteromonas sp. MMG010]MBQ4833147.1 hypothetical protein [Pseudoalteromonas sp. MMG010]
MQHCQQPIYVSDSHCSECGDALRQKRTLKTALDLQSDLFDELKQYYSNPVVITGKVTSMDYYKRKYSSSNTNLMYGFWWLNVEDAQGNTTQISINAEVDGFKSLKKGDVVSLISPSECTLNHRVAYAEDRRIVKHNVFAPAVVLHNDEGQRSHQDSLLNAGDRPSSWLFLVTFFAVLLGLIFAVDVPGGPATAAAAILSVIVLIFELNRTAKLHKRDLARYESVKKVVKSVLSMSMYDFGYDYYMRPAKDNDVICIGCQQRISGDVAHCYRCGVKQKKAVLLDKANDESAQVSSELEKAIGSHTTYSVADYQQQLMDEYSLKYVTPYIHKNVLAKHDKGEVQVDCMFAKVIDKVQKSNVDHSKTHYTTTTRTDTYVGNSFRGSSYKTHVETYERRNSSLQGQLILETSDYKVLKLSVAEDLLGSADVGDWVFYAQSYIQMDDSRDGYREVAYNVSKDVMFKSQAITEYGYRANEWVVWTLLICAVIATFVFDRGDYDGLLNAMSFIPYSRFVDEMITYLPLGIFAVFLGVITIWASIHAIGNSNRQKRSIAKLYTLMGKFKSDFKQIKERISQLQ